MTTATGTQRLTGKRTADRQLERKQRLIARADPLLPEQTWGGVQDYAEKTPVPAPAPQKGSREGQNQVPIRASETLNRHTSGLIYVGTGEKLGHFSNRHLSEAPRDAHKQCVCLTREAHVYVPNGENQGAHSACPQVGDRG